MKGKMKLLAHACVLILFFVSRIFSVPYYEATTLEQSLMLNRRRLDEIVPDEGSCNSQKIMIILSKD